MENIALFYLQRFSTTAAHLRRVLQRRAERAARTDPAGPPRAEMMGWIEALIAKLTAQGAVNDVAYAAGRTETLRRLGRSPEKIRKALAAKGVAPAVIAETLAETAVTAEGHDAALEAAMAFVRRRGLGAFRNQRDRDTDRKDLGALARAGFTLDVARRALEADQGE